MYTKFKKYIFIYILAFNYSFNPCPAYAGHGNDGIKQAKDDIASKLACLMQPSPACSALKQAGRSFE
jgi:hypothetical protein